MILNILFVTVAYFIGSFSSAIIVCKLFKLGNPCIHGSNNPGATNVLRIAGKLPALITLLGDSAKGFFPTILAMHYLHNECYIGIVMLSTLLGHVFPLFFNFKGGKGVATVIGCCFGLSFVFGITLFTIWILSIYISRISSVSALCTIIFAPVISWLLLHNVILTNYIIFMSIILFIRHKENFKRLWYGQENTI